MQAWKACSTLFQDLFHLLRRLGLEHKSQLCVGTPAPPLSWKSCRRKSRPAGSHAAESMAAGSPAPQGRVEQGLRPCV
jgi:hypothetical protein